MHAHMLPYSKIVTIASEQPFSLVFLNQLTSRYTNLLNLCQRTRFSGNDDIT